MISTSHTHVVRPRCCGSATAWIVPSVIGRRKLVWFDSPMTMLPSGAPSAVPHEVIDSAIDAIHPAVDEAHRLLDRVAHHALGAHLVGASLGDVHAVEGVEALFRREQWDSVHGGGTISPPESLGSPAG